MKYKVRNTCAFFLASMVPSLKLVLRYKWKHSAPTNAVFAGGVSPALMGSKPLLSGKNPPPDPPTVPGIEVNRTMLCWMV